MAHIINDGSFRGKLGGLVYTGYKGTKVVRLAARDVARPETVKQKSQKVRISLASNLLHYISPVLKIGFQAPQKCKTGMNEARSYFFKNIVAGIYPDQYIDFPKVIVSRGLIMPPRDVSAIRESEQVTFAWNALPRNEYSSGLDFLSVLLLSNRDELLLQSPSGELLLQNNTNDSLLKSASGESGAGVTQNELPISGPTEPGSVANRASYVVYWNFRAAVRHDGRAILNLPNTFTDPVHAWVFFSNPDREIGESQAKVSDSVYLRI